MRTAFFGLWSAYFARRLPCPQSAYSFSKEHVAPKSLFPAAVAHSPGNIIPFPQRLNNARGARKYTSHWKDGYVFYACRACPAPGHCGGSMVISPHGVHPPQIYKGPIARSVLRTMCKFPSMKDKLHEEVLDLDLAIEWDRKYPMTLEEQHWTANLKE